MAKDNLAKLDGAAFLKAYFRTHGITEREVRLCGEWEIFDNCRGLHNDAAGIEYADRMTEKIKRYRSLTHDDLRTDYDDAPWAWPSAMRFHKIQWKSVRDIRTLPGRPPILMCHYKENRYFFNVGKEEPSGDALEKMIEESFRQGEWYVQRNRGQKIWGVIENT